MEFYLVGRIQRVYNIEMLLSASKIIIYEYFPHVELEINFCFWQTVDVSTFHKY